MPHDKTRPKDPLMSIVNLSIHKEKELFNKIGGGKNIRARDRTAYRGLRKFNQDYKNISKRQGRVILHDPFEMEVLSFPVLNVEKERKALRGAIELKGGRNVQKELNRKIKFNREKGFTGKRVIEHIAFLGRHKLIPREKAQTLTAHFLNIYFTPELVDVAIQKRLIGSAKASEIKKHGHFRALDTPKTHKEMRAYQSLIAFYKAAPQEQRDFFETLAKLRWDTKDGKLVGIAEAARLAKVKLSHAAKKFTDIPRIYLDQMLHYYKKHGVVDARTTEGIFHQLNVLNKYEFIPIGAPDKKLLDRIIKKGEIVKARKLFPKGPLQKEGHSWPRRKKKLPTIKYLKPARKIRK